MARHRLDTTVHFDPDRADFAEADVEISFEIIAGEAEDIRVERMGGKPAPWNLHHHSDRHFEALCVEAASEDIEEALTERRWAERREGHAA